MRSPTVEPDGATWHPHGAPLAGVDVVVAGAGPAAWAMAAACGELRLRTVLVAPDPWAPWRQTYGIWSDQLEAAGLTGDAGQHPSALAQEWPTVTVATDQRGERSIGRAYGRLDNDAVAAHLRARAIEHDVTILRDTARGAAQEVGGMVVGLASGGSVQARVVIDATGHPGALVSGRQRGGRGDVPAWQVAHGIVARFDVPPIRPGTFVLMDWRAGAPADDGAGSPPAFLYAMDLGDGTFMVEETVLASRQAASPADLAARLGRRLMARGTPAGEILATEIVQIPMAAPVPPRQCVVAFGAAASLGQAATGYSVATSLQRAPLVALAIRQAVDRRATPSAVSAAAWRAVWPAGRRRVRALEQYGLGALLGMERSQLSAFFDAFFALPVAEWAPYHAGGDSLADTAELMRAVFAASPAAVRRRLMSGDVRALRGLLG